MFARQTISHDALAHLERIEDWVRRRYGLGEDQIVLVREEAGDAPGLPARMVTILFWSGPEARHRIRIFKPAHAVAKGDLPAAWLRSALRDEGEGECC